MRLSKGPSTEHGTAFRLMVQVFLAAAAVALVLPGRARADEPETSWTVTLQTDLRYTVEEKKTKERIPRVESLRLPWLRGKQERDLILVPRGFSRNENLVKLKVSTEVGRFKGVAELDFVWVGYSRELETLQDLTLREKVDPFRVEAHALYLDINGIFTKRLDLRIGQQVITWGTADQFNPTSNLSPLDLEDTLLFGDRIAVPAVRADFNIHKAFNLQVVWVPIFKPNHLPSTAPLGLSTPDRIPIVAAAMRNQMTLDRAVGEDVVAHGPTRITRAEIDLPERNIQNSQIGIKFTGKIGKQDFSLSYFHGHNGMPQPTLNRAFLINEENYIDTQVNLIYPKMHVVGFDMAGQIPWAKAIRRRHPSIKPVGWWFEAAVFFPRRVTMANYQTGFGLIPDGEYDYDGDGIPGGSRPVVVDTKPFAKWVLGFDYTFSESWYANIQWVHGFPDEFGAGGWFADLWLKERGVTVGRSSLEPGMSPISCFIGDGADHCTRELSRPRLADYIVSGIDFKFYRQTMLFRLFFILNMSGTFESYWKESKGRRVTDWHHPFSRKGFTMVIYPQLTWSMGKGAELACGGFIALGKDYTKFGDPAVGGSLIWTRAKFAF